MRKVIYLKAGLLTLLALCLMVGCDLTEPSDDENGQEYDPARFAGFWTGTTSQGRPISFYVNEEGIVDSLVVRIRMSLGLSYCTANFYADATAKTDDNGFTATVSYPGGNVSTEFNGTFLSDTTANGGYDGFSGNYSIICGSSLIIGTGTLFSTGTWEANKEFITVDIISPSDNSTVSDTVLISANAESINEISKVEFYINESLEHTDTSSSCSYSWDTNQYNDGSYTIKVIGYDTAGHTASDQVTVNVDNIPPPPWIYITSPSDGAQVSGTVDITVTAYSSDEISKVEFYINGSIIHTDTSSPYSYSWDTKQYSNDAYVIEVIVYDTFGQTKSDECTVNVSNPKWAFLTSGSVFSSPALGSDGTIYVGSWEKLYAINPDGTEQWGFLSGGWVMVNSSPGIGFDGTIYVGSSDDILYAVNPDGTKKWEFSMGDAVYSSPAIGSDGTIYVGSYDNKLYAINPDGTKKWEFLTGDGVSSSPAIDSDGTIYVGSWDDKLYAVNPDGTKKWEFLTGGNVSSSPAVGSDGTIYVGSLDDKLYAANPDGTKQWEFLTGGSVSSSPAIGSDGTIYVGSSDRRLYAVNPDGTKKWEFLTGGSVSSSPAIGSDGTIYVGSSDDILYAVNPDGTKQWEFLTGDWVSSSPAVGSDGTIYVGSYDDKLYAIPGSGSLADTPWPMFRHDLQHTGRQ